MTQKSIHFNVLSLRISGSGAAHESGWEIVAVVEYAGW